MEANRAAQGRDTEDREDSKDREDSEDRDNADDKENTEAREGIMDQLATEMEGSEEEVAAGYLPEDDMIVINIE